MIISWLRDGLGNQMFRYAAGRRLALKLGVEFKICKAWFDKYPYPDSYQLSAFNIYEKFASLEEVEEVKRLRISPDLGQEARDKSFDSVVLDYPDNVVLFGNRFCEKYFLDIADTIRNDFTLKTLSSGAHKWESFITADEHTTVSVHFRRNIIAMNDDRSAFVEAPHDRIAYMGLSPMAYYEKCLSMMSEIDKNLSLYIFSDDIDWVRKNFHSEFPMHYVSGTFDSENEAAEEIFLMSRCRHHIIANSSFSWWGAWLDPRPDKMVFAPKYFFNKEKFAHLAPDIVPEHWHIVEN